MQMNVAQTLNFIIFDEFLPTNLANIEIDTCRVIN